jgi:hypothetical protein
MHMPGLGAGARRGNQNFRPMERRPQSRSAIFLASGNEWHSNPASRHATLPDLYRDGEPLRRRAWCSAELGASRSTVDRFGEQQCHKSVRRPKLTYRIWNFRTFWVTEGLMKRPSGSLRFYLASSVTEETLVANSEERLHAVLANLEQCQAALVLGGHRDTAQLVSVAILELRIKLNRIEHTELKALCDAMLRDSGPPEKPLHPKSPEGQRGRSPVPLKLVK